MKSYSLYTLWSKMVCTNQGAYCQLLLLALFAIQGNVALADDVSFDVVNGYASNYSSYCGQTCNVTLTNRSFTANVLDGVCFPFSAGKSILDNTFGQDGYTIYEFTGLSGNTFVFTAMETPAVVAGTPYLIKVSASISNPTFNGVTFASTISDDFLNSSNSSSSLQFRGYYFKKQQYQLYDSNDSHTFYFLDENGAFTSGATGVYKDGGWAGAYAYFYIDDKTVTPSLNTGSSSGGGNGGASLADREQLTCVPTIYIDVFDAYREEGSTAPKSTKKVYQIKDTGGNYFDISDALIAEDPDITAGAALKDIKTQNKSDNYDLARIMIKDEDGTIKLRDELTTIRGRGNSTWYSAKKPFRLKFPSKTALLADNNGNNNRADAKSWTLLANASDKSMIQNAIASEIGAYIGMPFNPAYKFVDLVLNGKYQGTYQISDHMQTSPGRIDIDENDGWFIELVPSANEAFKEDPNFYITWDNQTGIAANVKTPEVTDDDSNDPKIVAISNWFNNQLAPSLSQYNDDKFDQEFGYRNYIDINSLVDYVISNEITGNFDGTLSNYVYKDVTDKKLKFGPLWDNDLSFNNYSKDMSGILVCENDAHYSLLNSIMQLILKDAVFLKALNKKWDQKSANIATLVSSKCDEISTSILCSVEKNYTNTEGDQWALSPWKIDGSGAIQGLDTKTYSTYDAAVDNIKSFVSSRVTFLDGTFHDKLAAVTGNSSYTLNAESSNSSTTPFSDYDNKIITLTTTNRTFTAGKWNTICLPTNLDADELKATFGDGVKLMEYTDFQYGKMIFTETSELSLEAGVPYLIKPSVTAGPTITFNNAILCARQPRTVRINDTDEYALTGTYFQTTVTTDGQTLLFDDVTNRFLPNTTASSLTGLSACVTGPNGAEYMPLFPENVQIEYNVMADDVSTLYGTYNGQTADVTLSGRKTIYGGEWNAICLPFNATADVITSVFGSGVKLQTLTSVTDESDETGTNIKVSFSKVSPVDVVAGMPYIIKPDADVSELTFEGVLFDCSTARTVEANGWQYVGTLQNTMIAGDGKYLVLMHNDELKKVGNTGNLNGCRAYFVMPDDAANTTAISMQTDDTTDAVSPVFSGNEVIGDVDIYNVNGQLVGRRLNDLPCGVYVVNGKKIIK